MATARTTAPGMSVSASHVPLRTKLAYGIGASAYGVKENGYTTFLLIFYNQVVGLPAGLVGAVVAIALVFDALIDPVLGILSDRTKSRWGRRHPWLYASALPIAITWMLLWNPPTGTHLQILAYLGVIAVLARGAIATNEVPSLAMAPELTPDYNERTEIIRYRYLFGWLGGMIMFLLVYSVFLVPPIGAQSGPKAFDGYSAYGIFGALFMMTTVLVSALGTHRIMASKPYRTIVTPPPREFVRQLGQTLSNRAFLILMASGVCISTSGGIGLAISQYHLTYVWQFSPGQLQIYGLTLIAGIFGIFLAVGAIGRALGKVKATIVCAILGAVFVCASYTLRLFGLMPAVGSPWLLPLFLVFNTVGTAFGVGANIIGASMMSDVVEDSEERTGRREEGLFFAGTLFMQKCSSGLGIFVAGQILQLAAFPVGMRPGQVPEAILDAFTLMFIIATMALSLGAALIVSRFPFGEAEHKARLAKLAVASDI